jgi:hypothetical protein
MSWCGVRLSGLVEREWQPGTPEDKQRARAALAGALGGWLVAGDALLTPEGGWPLGPPASSSDTWSAILYVIAHASDAVARYSEIVRRRGSREGLEPYARHAQIEIDRLAALIIRELGESHIDRDAILDEADGFVDEVDDEHDGMLHTADAIGSLLQARLVCAEDQLDLPASELATAAVGILAPLLAQRARVLV